MKTTLFKKYLVTTMGILIVAFTILGVFLLTFVKQYWRDYEFDRMNNSLGDISALASECVTTSNGELIMGNGKTWSMLTKFSKTYGYDLVLVDAEGRIVTGTRLQDKVQAGSRVPDEILNSLARDKSYEEKTNTGNFYKDTEMCAAAPVKVGVGGTSTTAGYIFVCSSKDASSDIPWKILNIFLYATAAALIVSAFLAGVFSYRQSRQLKKLSLRAKEFAKSDFSGRLPVKSRDEIGRLTMAFNDMADALEQDEQVRRDFIANISHELKTPMTTIAGFIDGILDGTIPEIKHAHYLAIVSEEVGRLSRLVTSMLSLAKIDSGKVSLYKTEFSAPDIIVNILMTFEDQLEKKDITIECLDSTKGVQLFGDQTLLHQVFYNLIENAVKFTPDRGTIIIDLHSKDNKTCFAVKNTGKGISPGDLPFIFNKFYKADKSRSKDKKSMGLGLYIVKTIVNLHGGEIFVVSEPNKETCFYGWIPENNKE